jgi:fatty acid desaturase
MRPNSRRIRFEAVPPPAKAVPDPPGRRDRIEGVVARGWLAVMASATAAILATAQAVLAWADPVAAIAGSLALAVLGMTSWSLFRLAAERDRG